jgi:hypothetical protein
VCDWSKEILLPFGYLTVIKHLSASSIDSASRIAFSMSNDDGLHAAPLQGIRMMKFKLWDLQRIARVTILSLSRKT